MAKKLTRRQRQFLSEFLDYYQEYNDSIHYTELATQLGIGKVTAYEMLRLLEKHELVESEYYLPEGARGPGRASVRFRPTKQASHLLEDVSGKEGDLEVWKARKEHILQELHAGRVGGYEELLDELLVRISDQRSPLIYVTEMITATILTVSLMKKSSEENGLLNQLRRIGLPGELGLSALAGIGSALSLAENINIKLSTFLLEQGGRYQGMIKELSEDNRKRLLEYTREIARIVKRK